MAASLLATFSIFPPKDEKGEQVDLQRGSPTHILIAIAIFYYILYRLASLWVQYIDPQCAKVVNAFTNWAYGEPRGLTNGHATRNGNLEKGVLPA